ncbi:acyltransferase family protein [Amphibacillus cookii]|uniref:acyltransferase family protein n=1 Tax=Amphibacillus cookii TaxID=767787 RepID=UPI00195EC022|nr:acyltransferase family protein [Amphibacillus cookii]MBM7540857.1 fucose 4-O-acetylase-like acetyltransferase [Amphibacillus cookii]
MKRDAFFDNAKFILIFFVVFGHVIQPITVESEMIATLYRFIYLFHMPAIILVSGFFAKGSSQPSYLFGLVRKLLIPYLIFQLIYTAYYDFLTNSGWDTPLFEPHWSLWFLLSLFSWHLLLIVFKRFSAKKGIALSVMIGLIIGYFDGIGHVYSLSRTFVFFPFFLSGYWLKKEQLFVVKRKSIRMISLAVISLALLLSYIMPDFQMGWLFGSASYQSLDAPTMGAFIRTGVYIVAFLLIFSLYAWVPRRQLLLTKFGQQTIYVYLLHGLFVQFFRERDLIQINSLLDFVVVIAISLALVLLLSSKPIFISFQPIIETKTTAWKQLSQKPS